MGTLLDSSKVLEFANNALWCAPAGTTLPTAPYPFAKPAGWQIVGRVTSDGFTGTRDVNNTTEYDSTGVLAFEGWSELRETIAFTAMETNNVTESLKNPGSTRSVTTTPTAETQTVTVTGTPTGGTFTPVYKGIPSTTPVAYNAAGSALQTSLQTIPALATAAVSGSAGGPYTVTFPTGEGNAAQLSFVNALTGGTTPAVASAEATAGVVGVYQWLTSSSATTTPPQLWWALDEIHTASGLASVRCFAGKATVTDMGAVTKGGSRKTGFSVTKYEDIAIGGLERIVSNLPAYIPGNAIA